MFLIVFFLFRGFNSFTWKGFGVWRGGYGLFIDVGDGFFGGSLWWVRF